MGVRPRKSTWRRGARYINSISNLLEAPTPLFPFEESIGTVRTRRRTRRKRAPCFVAEGPSIHWNCFVRVAQGWQVKKLTLSIGNQNHRRRFGLRCIPTYNVSFVTPTNVTPPPARARPFYKCDENNMKMPDLGILLQRRADSFLPPSKMAYCPSTSGWIF